MRVVEPGERRRTDTDGVAESADLTDVNVDGVAVEQCDGQVRYDAGARGEHHPVGEGVLAEQPFEQLSRRPVELSGLVLTRSCRPVVGALVDLWQADDRGEYDNKGFRLRGHVFTDAEGRYAFRTIMPGLYPGRTRHYHVKVQAPARPVLTTQLYFPDEPLNRSDDFFHPELVMQVAKGEDALRARFDVVLALR